ncbi:NAD(P)/FAD-dependent oxidoreductase [Pseudoalteromonas piscicida]|uniref:Amine oxidase domain-containing protein n=1 Tax=Pseudoalteromonas piscicida TaxID=43662 RepID=A0ABM6NCE1_PSEO7|nr:NAD(P)/FAD-dependent oxidoreductase [Pseudoalteromonas piscicida]ATD06586.1 hypothetical protein PPIS_a1470 [Pseudoalteromonas piscicida]WPU33293.1 NAD(P)/FAD-dependent oxidoreductase [Pseudoalteromonas piscicida]
MSKNTKSVIIIGAGMSGLSTAAYSQMNGYETTIFELHETPGGCCTSWQRKDFTFDWCLSWLKGTGHKDEMSLIWNELGCLDDVSIYHINTFNTVIFPDGQKVTFHADPDKLELSLIEQFPEDTKHIKEFCGYIRKLAGCSPHFPFLKNTGLMTWWEKAKMMWKLLPYMKTLMNTMSISIEDYSKRFNNPILAESLNWIIYDRLGSFPVMPFAFNIANAADKAIGVPDVGSLGLAKKLASRVKKLGGKIHYKAKVDQILVENNKAIGVRLSNGQEHFADYVISASDSYNTTQHLLRGAYPHPVMDKMYSHLHNDPKGIIFPSLVAVFIAVNKDYTDHDPYSTYLIDDKLKSELIGINHGGIAVQVRSTLLPKQAPEGKSVLYITYLTDSQPWQNLNANSVQSEHISIGRNSHTRRRRSVEYKVAKKGVGSKILQFLSQHFEELENNVEFIDVVTPLTCERYTKNYNGTVLGWDPFSPYSEEFEKYINRHGPTLPHLDNFYFSGHWGTSNGVAQAVASGRHIAQYLCLQDSKRFRVTPFLSNANTATQPKENEQYA